MSEAGAGKPAEEVKAEDVADIQVDSAVEVNGEGSETKVEEDSVVPKGEDAESKPKTEYDLTVPKIEGKSEEDVTAAMDRVSKQVNFYFSDANLPVDKFFFSLTVCNPQGWVPLKTILSFKRMRQFEEYGIPFVATALRRTIADEGKDPLVEVSENGENVRRVRPLEPNSKGWDRSVYVKGFGEGDNEDNTQEKIEEYFEQFGKMNAIRKRRADDESRGAAGARKGKFKGSVFAEFAYDEDVTKFLEREEIPKYSESGPDMVFMSKDKYVKMKAEEKGFSIHKINTGGSGGGRQAGKGKDAGSAKFNAFREMAKIRKGEAADLAKIPSDVAVVGKPLATKTPERGGRDNDRKRRRDDDGDDKPAKYSKPEFVMLEYNGASLKCDPVTGQVMEPENVPFKQNAVVKFVNCGKDGDWKDLKQRVIDSGIDSPFIAYPPGSEFGRLAKQNSETVSDEELTKLNDAKIPFGGSELQWEKMSEEAQREFWVMRASFQGKMAAEQQASKQSDRRDYGRGGRGRGGHGGRGGGRGGRGGKYGGRGGNRGGRGDRKPREERGDNGGLPPTVASVGN